jgi:hypothetical protein
MKGDYFISLFCTSVSEKMGFEMTKASKEVIPNIESGVKYGLFFSHQYDLFWFEV